MKTTNGLRSVERRVLGSLHQHAGKSRALTLPVSVLCADTLAPERTVREALRCLEMFGYIRRHFKAGGITTYELIAGK